MPERLVPSHESVFYTEGVSRLLQYRETEEMRKSQKFFRKFTRFTHTGMHFGTLYNIGCSNSKKYQRPSVRNCEFCYNSDSRNGR
jgi:hypothetical protein